MRRTAVRCERGAAHGHSSDMRGFTLVELVVALTVGGVVLAIAVPRARASLDRITVHAAASDVRATLRYARGIALAGNSAVAVDVDSAAGVIRIRRGSEVLRTRGVGHAHGVRLSRTRDSMTYDVRGLGRGAANLSVIIRRGVAVETVFVSRLGRVR
jgi:prepilin-type N-terminal cleavage/methylation domain-containing protein